MSDGAFGQALAAALADIAAVVDQSHGRVAIVIAGAKARAVLAKGTAVDLDPSRFRPGQVAATQMAHVGVHITAVAPDAFELAGVPQFRREPVRVPGRHGRRIWL